VTIHTDHPFLEPESEHDPERRFRGRLGGSVVLFTAGGTGDVARAGLTVSSLMVARGEPSRVLALLDPDADLTETLEATGRAVVNLLAWQHRDLADAFAGLAPAPGGAFRMAEWEDTAWGPCLVGVSAWAGVALESTAPVGWSSLVTCRIEHLALLEDQPPLVHRRGRYQRPGDVRMP
jgi:flavin reductase (DIM6/NTAB) family NADH-FMN oxidoreductase RutF